MTFNFQLLIILTQHGVFSISLHCLQYFFLLIEKMPPSYPNPESASVSFLSGLLPRCMFPASACILTPSCACSSLGHDALFVHLVP